MNKSLLESGGDILVVFSILRSTEIVAKGDDPSFIAAAHPEKGKTLYQEFIDCHREDGRVG